MAASSSRLQYSCADPVSSVCGASSRSQTPRTLWHRNPSSFANVSSFVMRAPLNFLRKGPRNKKPRKRVLTGVSYPESTGCGRQALSRIFVRALMSLPSRIQGDHRRVSMSRGRARPSARRLYDASHTQDCLEFLTNISSWRANYRPVENYCNNEKFKA